MEKEEKEEVELKTELEKDTYNKLIRYSQNTNKSKEEIIKEVIREELKRDELRKKNIFDNIDFERLKVILEKIGKLDALEKMKKNMSFGEFKGLFNEDEFNYIYKELDLLEIISKAKPDEFLEGIADLLNIPATDRLKHYQISLNYLDKSGLDKDEENFNILKDSLKESHIFELSKTLSNVLNHTKTDENQKLPFNPLNISCFLQIKERVYFNILVLDYIKKEENTEDRAFFVSVIERQKGNEWGIKLGFDTSKEIKNFVNSFLLFLNEPEVKYRKVEFSRKNNERRIKRGLNVLPNSLVISLTGKIYKYIKDIEETEGKINYSYRHWVRGHYTRFLSQKHWKNLYSKDITILEKEGYQVKEGIIRKWVKPFVRGRGILVKKSYNLNE